MHIDDDFKSIIALLLSNYNPNQQLATQLAEATGIDLQPFWDMIIELHDWEHGLDTEKNWRVKEFIKKRLAGDKNYLLQNFHKGNNRFAHYQGQPFSELLQRCYNFERLNFHNSLSPALHPSVCNFRSLKRLSIAYCCMPQLPDNFGDLVQLEWLEGQYNFLENLPDNFGNLQRLRLCCLRGNRLRRLPESFANLHNLQELDLRENPDMDWAQAFSILLKMPNLKWLAWGGNIKMNQFSGVEILDWSHYNARQQPADDKFQFTHWKAFGVAPKPPLWGNILRVAAQFSDLDTLRLSGCELEFLPATIGILKNIRHLYLSDNCLKTLPNEIGKLENLESLYLANNLFSEVPKVIAQLKKLQQLNITGNYITEIPTWLEEQLPNLKVRLELDLPQKNFRT